MRLGCPPNPGNSDSTGLGPASGGGLLVGKSALHALEAEVHELPGRTRVERLAGASWARLPGRLEGAPGDRGADVGGSGEQRLAEVVAGAVLADIPRGAKA